MDACYWFLLKPRSVGLNNKLQFFSSATLTKKFLCCWNCHFPFLHQSRQWRLLSKYLTKWPNISGLMWLALILLQFFIGFKWLSRNFSLVSLSASDLIQKKVYLKGYDQKDWISRKHIFLIHFYVCTFFFYKPPKCPSGWSNNRQYPFQTSFPGNRHSWNPVLQQANKPHLSKPFRHRTPSDTFFNVDNIANTNNNDTKRIIMVVWIRIEVNVNGFKNPYKSTILEGLDHMTTIRSKWIIAKNSQVNSG